MNAAMQSSTAFQTAQRPMTTDRRLSVSKSAAFTTHRAMVRRPDFSWAESVIKRLDELTSLPPGWDGYTGKPVSFQTASFVATMLERLCQDGVPAPSLVPGSDGSLQVEWHRNSYDVELDVLGPQNVIATRVDLHIDEEITLEIQNDVTEIVAWVSALSD